ncbi:MAG TPA: C-terminal binding protein [Capillimicrobium sp.]|jgi:D-3-phosphoglycerate dehydrogenase
MSGPLVLITDAPWGSTHVEEAALSEVRARVVLAGSGGAEEALLELAPQADAILTCFAQVTAAVVAAAPRLQVVGRYGVGTDNIAVAEATRRDIPVTNVPVYCVEEVAEHVLGMLLSLVRGLHRYDRAVREGDWSLAPGLPTRRVAGQTLGVIGFGAIGQHVARLAQGIGMSVIASGRDDGPISRAGVEPVGIEELARRSDAVTLHVPLTEETRGLVDARFLSLMRPSAYLVNCARGAIVDHDALAQALADGAIAGAAMDVFEPERLPRDHPLLRSDRLLATPHTAYYSEESMTTLARLAAENVAAVLAGRRPAALVNPDVLTRPRWAHLQA